MNLVKRINKIFILATLLFGVACGPTRPPEQSEGHISSKDYASIDKIPDAVSYQTLLPKPEKRVKLETYTVIVSNVPVKELLFSMARDAKINLDIYENINGRVTLNAIDQTMPQILERISQQVSIRYEINSGTLKVQADTPFLRNYRIDYVNMSRESKGTVSVATTLGSTGQGSIGEKTENSGGSNNSGNGNSSLMEVNNYSDNKFWDTLEKNINLLIYDIDDEGRKTSDHVIINKETGVIAIRATQKQHNSIQEFLDIVLSSARRQVLIEATIAEIKLSDRYQAGVDWTLLASDPLNGVGVVTDFRNGNLGQTPFSTITIADTLSDGDQMNVTIKALEQFGDVKVLSSPKVMAINNQPAMLKVVDNFVYFEMEVDSSISTNAAITTFDTEVKTVPVGFVMSVTPHISENDVVTLNVRPTISRIIDKVVDPNPEFKKVDVVSEVPVIQVREIESVLQVNSGDTAVIGGLMQDTVNDSSSGIPFLSKIPIIGGLFSYKDDIREKSELVIFIKPVVVKHASLIGDLSEYRKFLPDYKEVDLNRSVEQ
ncbi:MAG: pilus (MSHA type) biogenesis protein MshL [Gammaproteobacteria bacterium]|nr:pilus (MSHA type) biogenesis protein MshL [Gammaproteobacteria bacterium]